MFAFSWSFNSKLVCTNYMKKSQKQVVIEHILELGGVSNFWAIENYILRLGAIILDLTKEGWEFDRKYGKELGKDRKFWKNYYYKCTKKPEKYQK